MSNFSIKITVSQVVAKEKLQTMWYAEFPRHTVTAYDLDHLMPGH